MIFNNPIFRNIFHNHYWVKNQNGFKGAVKHFLKGQGYNLYTNKEIKRMIQNYPTKYPCEIYIDERIFEQYRIFIHSPNGQIKNI